MQSTVELARGASLFDGTPLVLLASGLLQPSMNRKTGPMIQTWIIRQDGLPSEVVRDGLDTGQCGSCPLRRTICYVDLRPVNTIWRKWMSGDVPRWDGQSFRYPLRLGAYGDPAMLPLDVWSPLIRAAPLGYTGYTHQWRWCDEGWKQYLHASVESLEESLIAQEAGWRTYRIATAQEERTREELECLYNTAGLQCWRCQKCSGEQGRSIVGRIHGWDSKIRNFDKLRARSVNPLSEDSH